MHEAGEVSVAELHRADKLTATCSGTVHDAASRHASFNAQAPISTIMPFCSASVMNSAGGTRAAHGMLPARQSLETEHLAVDFRLRLVMSSSSLRLTADRRSICNAKRSRRRRSSSGSKKRAVLAAVFLGAIQRGIGVGEQSDDVSPIVGVDGDADAQADGIFAGPSPRTAAQRLATDGSPAARRCAAAASWAHTRVNSSPPVRAMKSPSAAISRRRATAHKSSSPAV